MDDRRILDYERGSGKTHACIRESILTGNHILVPNRAFADEIRRICDEIEFEEMFGEKLPTVFTVEDLFTPGKITEEDGRDLIIDEACVVMDWILGKLGRSYSMMTLTANERKFKE